jgi:hypothetical protein
MKRKKRGKPARRKAKSLVTVRGGKPARGKTDTLVIIKENITLIAELCGIANFFIALYYFIKEFL